MKDKKIGRGMVSYGRMVKTTKRFDGKTYHLITDGVTKAEAHRSAEWNGKYNYVRIERLGRGNYRVWQGPRRPR